MTRIVQVRRPWSCTVNESITNTLFDLCNFFNYVFSFQLLLKKSLKGGQILCEPSPHHYIHVTITNKQTFNLP